MFTSALLLILVHSYYSWSENKNKDHLTASFKQLFKSSHSAVVASAVEHAVKSHGEDPGSVCEEIIRIVRDHALGMFALHFCNNVDYVHCRAFYFDQNCFH